MSRANQPYARISLETQSKGQTHKYDNVLSYYIVSVFFIFVRDHVHQSCTCACVSVAHNELCVCVCVRDHYASDNGIKDL